MLWKPVGSAGAPAWPGWEQPNDERAQRLHGSKEQRGEAAALPLASTELPQCINAESWGAYEDCGLVPPYCYLSCWFAGGRQHQVDCSPRPRLCAQLCSWCPESLQQLWLLATTIMQHAPAPGCELQGLCAHRELGAGMRVESTGQASSGGSAATPGSPWP